MPHNLEALVEDTVRPNLAGVWQCHDTGRWIRRDLRCAPAWAFSAWQSADPHGPSAVIDDTTTWPDRWWWCKNCSVTAAGFVDSLDEAKAAADAWARENGWVLLDDLVLEAIREETDLRVTMDDHVSALGDSLALLLVVMRIEETLGVELSDEVLSAAKYPTVRHIALLLEATILCKLTQRDREII